MSGIRRRSYLTGLGAASASVLAGCLGGEDTQSSDGGGNTTVGDSNNGEWPDLSGKELHFLSPEPSGAAQEYWGMVTKEFKQATGASIKLEFSQAGSSGQTRIVQLLQAGSPPNVYPANAARTLQFHNVGVIRPLTAITKHAIERFGEPPASSRVRIEGEDYLLPQWAAYSVHWYRSDITDIVPDTWEKVLTYAEKATAMSEKTHGTYVPAGLGTHSVAELMTYAFANDCRTFERDSSGNLTAVINNGSNRDRWIELLNWKKECHQYSPLASDSSWTTCINAIPNKTAYSGWYGGVRPKNTAIDQGASFAKKLHPTIPKKRSQNTWASPSGLVSFKQADNEVTQAFLQFWLQKKYLNPLYWKFSQIHNVPVWPEILHGQYYKKKKRELSPAWTDDDLAFYLEEAPKHGVIWNYETDPKNPYIGDVFSAHVIDQFKYDVLVSDKNPADLIDTYNQKLQQAIDKASQ